LHGLIVGLLLPILPVQAFKDLIDPQCQAEMQLTCPILSCDDEADLKDDGNCFRHDGE